MRVTLLDVIYVKYIKFYKKIVRRFVSDDKTRFFWVRYGTRRVTVPYCYQKINDVLIGSDMKEQCWIILRTVRTLLLFCWETVVIILVSLSSVPYGTLVPYRT